MRQHCSSRRPGGRCCCRRCLCFCFCRCCCFFCLRNFQDKLQSYNIFSLQQQQQQLQHTYAATGRQNCAATASATAAASSSSCREMQKQPGSAYAAAAAVKAATMQMCALQSKRAQLRERKPARALKQEREQECVQCRRLSLCELLCRLALHKLQRSAVQLNSTRLDCCAAPTLRQRCCFSFVLPLLLLLLPLLT